MSANLPDVTDPAYYRRHGGGQLSPLEVAAGLMCRENQGAAAQRKLREALRLSDAESARVDLYTQYMTAAPAEMPAETPGGT